MILALDQGTTSSRAIVFDRAGEVRAVAQREFAQHYPQPGWVEHDAIDIWQTQRDVAAEVIERVGASAIGAIGITNQRETTLLWDRGTGEPLSHAIVWQDRRTAKHCEALRDAGHTQMIQSKTGLVLDAYFSGTKLGWLLDHLPGARARADSGELCFGTIDSWLAWQLTAGKRHVTDPSNASRTLLFNIHTQDWDDELLALFNVPRSVLPTVVPSSGIAGYSACAGLPHGLAIAGIAGDQQAALFGQACHRAGMAKNTYGTGCFLLMHTGERAAQSRHRLLSTVAWREAGGPEFALEGSVFVAGAAVQWLRDGLGIIHSAGEMEALAASVPDTGDVWFVPALAGLGSPYWDPHARGTLVGLTRGTTRAHIARATLESIALQSAELIDAMQQDSGVRLTELRVDGGATANALLMQMQADLLGVPVVRPKVTETTALGAAYLAGLATGFWRDRAEIAALWTRERVFEPALSRDAAAARIDRWRAAVARASGWAKPAP
jgi:glycerol kinase